MKKLTKISWMAAYYDTVGFFPDVYGYVSNGVTTITKIDGVNQSFFGTPRYINREYFPSYSTINGKKYNWIIDSTLSNGDVVRAHLDIGTKIIVNNPLLYVTHGCYKGKEEETHDIISFYAFDGDKIIPQDINGNSGIPPYSTGKLSLYYGYTEINGKNNFKATCNQYVQTSAGTTYYGAKFVPGETYRFTWSIRSRSTYQDVVATSEYEVVSRDCIIPQSWCDQITTPDITYYRTNRLEVECAIVIDGKPVSEWAQLAGSTRSSVAAAVEVVVTADSTLLPSISSVTLADTNGVVPSSWKEYVQSLSNVAISAISCSGVLGSWITKVQLKVKDTTVDGTTSSLPKTSVIREYGTFDVEVTVTDSRNRTATKSSKITFLSYSAPTISAVVSRRCTENGIIDNDGTFVKVSGTPNVYSCNGKNSYHVYVSYKRTNESTYSPEQEVTLPATIGTKDATTKLGNFDPEYSYDIRYRITDAINSVYYVDYVSTVIMMMHFMRGGRGVAFGQKATVEYCVDTSFNALFRGNVGFEINKKFYTIEQIINALNITGVDSLSWVENNKKEF